VEIHHYSLENLLKGNKVLTSARLQVDGFAADCDVLTRVEGTSTFGKYSYEPSLFVVTYSITKEQQLELSFVGSVLERLQHTSPTAGSIIGMDGKLHTSKLGARPCAVCAGVGPRVACVGGVGAPSARAEASSRSQAEAS